LIEVVDDDPALRLVMRNTLEQAGFAVEEAENGRTALAIFERRNPEMVLLDVVMPDMDGFDTCEALRRLPGGEHSTILMVTGLDDVESIHRAFAAGATDFITKPINWTIMGYRLWFMHRANRAINNLLKSESALARAQRIARLGSWELDLLKNEFHCSTELCRLLDLDRHAPGLPFEALFNPIHPEDREHVQRTILEALAGRNPYSLTYRIIWPDGEERVVHSQSEIIFDEARRPSAMAGTIQDITEVKHAEEQIRLFAFYDSLTGLANRLLFKERITHTLAHARRHNRLIALLSLDLDRFKRINDTLGHHVGDQMLRVIAERLKDCVGAPDSSESPRDDGKTDCISRAGGDEFSILLAEIVHPRNAAKMARRIVDLISRPLDVGGYEVSMTASIGISIFPFDGEDVETLLKNAEIAMYYAKEKGKNHYLFYKDTMNANAFERLAIENDLRKALEHEEFLLHYQPQLDTSNGQVVGCEALIRWQHPELGLVPPLKFIPVAEEAGLIVAISDWVLRTACAQAKAWQEAGLGAIRIAVNLSGEKFSLQEVTGTVARTLSDSRLEPRYLEVELTESILLQKDGETLSTLQGLKELGVRIAIDDFGTGYSSLSYLKSFPIDTLKIDRSFVRDITVGPKETAITKAIITLSHNLELNIIAEGVETEEQKSLLLELGCQQMQGYLFSQPLPAEAMREYLTTFGPRQHLNGPPKHRPQPPSLGTEMQFPAAGTFAGMPDGLSD